MSIKENTARRASFIMPLLRHNDPGSCGSSNASTTSSSNSIDPVDLKAFVGSQSLARSRSFGGLLIGSGGSCSSTSSRRHNNMNSVRAGGTWTPGVLGQGYGSPGVPRKLMNSLGTLTSSSSQSPFSPLSNNSHYHGHGGSLKSIPASIPKTPRPNKARSAVEALVEGLKACIVVAEEEISSLKEGVREMSLSDGQSMLQGRIYEMEKTAKTTERTLKKLEYQLSLVEELGEQYSLQQRLREGVRAMAYAFSISEGKERDSALANVKAGFKECTDVLCSLEGQLETFLGTFKMTMKGIQGFARLCPGDVFEITIKHGIQKWKTRGKVGKDGTQCWDFPRATFRAVLGEVMFIKAAEVKTLGKQILLGNKFCEATELFSAHSQLMTVNLNPSGSLKLNIVVTWCPLDTTEDYIHGSSAAMAAASAASPSRKRRLSPTTPDMTTMTMSSNMSSTLPMQSSPSLSIMMMGSISSRNSTVPLWERTLESIDDTVESGSFRFSSLTGSKSARLLKSKQESSQSQQSSTELSNQRSALCSDPSGNFSMKKRDSEDSSGSGSGSGSGSNSSSSNNTTASASDSSPSGGKETTTGLRQLIRMGEKEKENFKVGLEDEDGLIHSRNGVMLIMDDEDPIDGLRTLRDSILKLISFLEDIKGQWPELENLENHLGQLERMIHDGPGPGHGVLNSSSTSSLNIESALECFDFLDSVVVEEGIDSYVSSASPPPPLEENPIVGSNRIFNIERYARHRPSTEIMDPKMTARTTDSGISSLGGHTHSRSPSPARSTTGSPAIPLVTGNAQLDLALETHIHICLQLVQNLGSFGPLKTREQEAVLKLMDQGEILGTIITEAKNPSAYGKVVDLTGFPTLQLLWERITDMSSPRCPLVTTADMSVHGLELEVRPVVNYKYPKESQLSSRVAKILTQSMLDTGNGEPFNPSAVLTVFQFQLFLTPHQHSFYKLVEQIADEELVQVRLQGEGQDVIPFVKSMGERLPSKKILMSMIRWLISPEKEAATTVKEFIQDLSCLHTNRRDLINIGLEMMESDWNLDRESACLLICILEATNAIEQLAYLAQSDPTAQVRSRAKDSLISLGQDRILEQLTLSTHGFQGLAVN